MTFFGEFRGGQEAEHHVHESPRTMLGPLVLLAIGSATVGFVHVPERSWPRLPARGARGPPRGLAAVGGHGDRRSSGWSRPTTSTSRSTDAAGTHRAVAQAAAARARGQVGLRRCVYDWLVASGRRGRQRRRALEGRRQLRVIDGAVNGTAGVVDAVSRQVATGADGPRARLRAGDLRRRCGASRTTCCGCDGRAREPHAQPARSSCPWRAPC